MDIFWNRPMKVFLVVSLFPWELCKTVTVRMSLYNSKNKAVLKSTLLLQWLLDKFHSSIRKFLLVLCKDGMGESRFWQFLMPMQTLAFRIIQNLCWRTFIALWSTKSLWTSNDAWHKNLHNERSHTITTSTVYLCSVVLYIQVLCFFKSSYTETFREEIHSLETYKLIIKALKWRSILMFQKCKL